MCETKIVYIIKVGIPQYVHRKLIKDVADTPFSSLFDKTTNSQVKNSMANMLCTGLNRIVELFADTVAHCL